MNNELLNKKNNSLINKVTSTSIQQWKQSEILNNFETHELSHIISCQKYGAVTGLHTHNIQEFFYADYNNGEIILGFNIKTGQCFYRQKWEPNLFTKFEGHKNCDGFLLKATNENGILRAFSLNRRESFFAKLNSQFPVNDVELTSERFIITACGDGICRIFSSADFQLIGILKGATRRPALTFALLPYSDCICVGYDDGVLAVYSYKKEELVWKEKITTRPIISVTASEYKIFVATELDIFITDIKAEKWENLHSNVEITKIKHLIGDVWTHSPFILSANKYRNNSIANSLIVAKASGEVTVLNGESSFKSGSHYHRHKEAVTCLMTHPDGYVLSGSVDGTVRRLNIAEKEYDKVYFELDGVRNIDIAFNEKKICIAGINNDKAKLHDLNTGEMINEFNHNSSVRCVKFAVINEKEYLFTGGWDGKIKQIDIKTNELVHIFKFPGNVCDIEIHNNLLFGAFYNAEQNRGFSVWDLIKNEKIKECRPHVARESWGGAVALNISAPYLFSCGDDGVIYQWDLNNFRIIKSFNHGKSVRSVVVDSRKELLYSCSINSTIKIWNIDSGELIKTIYDGEGKVYSIALSSDDNFLFSGNQFGIIKKYEISNGTEVNKILHGKNRIWKIKYEQSLDAIIAVSEDGRVSFYSADSCKVICTYFNLSYGYLWTIPPGENDLNGYYWTDRTDLVNIIENKTEVNSNSESIDNKLIQEYHKIHNNQKLVMSKINGEKFSKIFDVCSKMALEKQSLEKILAGKRIGLLSE